MHGEKILDYAPKFDFTAATTQVKVVVSDGRQDKTAESLVKAYVNMDVATLYVGSQQLANTAHDKYPDAFGLVSLKDLKTYSIDYALSSPEMPRMWTLSFIALVVKLFLVCILWMIQKRWRIQGIFRKLEEYPG